MGSSSSRLNQQSPHNAGRHGRKVGWYQQGKNNGENGVRQNRTVQTKPTGKAGKNRVRHAPAGSA